MLILFLLSSFPLFSQDVLVLGRKIELKSGLDTVRFEFQDSLNKKELHVYDAIFIFSTANSFLSPEGEKQLIDFVNAGGNLYLGAENEPFSAESNQLLLNMFNRSFYGNFSSDSLEIDSRSNFKACACDKSLSGYTTVSFPMDYRLQVEAWSNDNPIILSGSFGAGKIIIDGGYSRFYDASQATALLDEFLLFFFRD